MKLKAAAQAQAADLVIKITLSEGNTFLDPRQTNGESAVVILVKDMEVNNINHVEQGKIALLLTFCL